MVLTINEFVNGIVLGCALPLLEVGWGAMGCNEVQTDSSCPKG